MVEEKSKHFNFIEDSPLQIEEVSSPVIDQIEIEPNFEIKTIKEEESIQISSPQHQSNTFQQEQFNDIS